jgi:hypothetical protein
MSNTLPPNYLRGMTGLTAGELLETLFANITATMERSVTEPMADKDPSKLVNPDEGPGLARLELIPEINVLTDPVVSVQERKLLQARLRGTSVLPMLRTVEHTSSWIPEEPDRGLMARDGGVKDDLLFRIHRWETGTREVFISAGADKSRLFHPAMNEVIGENVNFSPDERIDGLPRGGRRFQTLNAITGVVLKNSAIVDDAITGAAIARASSNMVQFGALNLSLMWADRIPQPPYGPMVGA